MDAASLIRKLRLPGYLAVIQPDLPTGRLVETEPLRQDILVQRLAQARWRPAASTGVHVTHPTLWHRLVEAVGQ